MYMTHLYPYSSQKTHQNLEPGPGALLQIALFFGLSKGSKPRPYREGKKGFSLASLGLWKGPLDHR